MSSWQGGVGGILGVPLTRIENHLNNGVSQARPLGHREVTAHLPALDTQLLATQSQAILREGNGPCAQTKG